MKFLSLLAILALANPSYASKTGPGGSKGQLQVNNGDSFGGLTNPAAISQITSKSMIDPRAYGASCAGAWYSITSSSLNAGGTGYVVGDTFIVEDNNLDGHMRGGVNATGHVLTVNGSGAVLTYSIDNAGTGYYTGAIGPVFPTSGTGSGLAINILTVNTAPSIPTTTLASGGSGWGVGDVFYVPNASTGNYMTGRVNTVSSGAVSAYTINNPGGDYSVASNAPAIAAYGLGIGLKLNITGVTGNASNGTWDDTYGLVNASTVASLNGGAVMVPDACWANNVMATSGTSFVGEQWATNYSYSDLTVSGDYLKVSGGPHVFIFGTPNFGFDFNNQGGLAFVGFEVRAYAPGAYGNTGCLGSFNGGGGFNSLGSGEPRISLFQMSAKGCYAGLGNPGGGGSYLFVTSVNSDYGSNNNGIWGPFSDLITSQDTISSSGTGIWLTSSAGGLARIIAPRLEYDTTGIELDSGGLQSQIIGLQVDRMNACGVLVNNAAQVTMTGGLVKGAGLEGTLTVTGAANNGAGLIRLTVTSSGLQGGNAGTNGLITGDVVNVTGVTGTTEANGTWTLTVVDSAHIDLQSSTFANAYVSGGIAGVNGKSASICLNGATDFHASNLVFGGSSAGALIAPAYAIDSVSSSRISINNGEANAGNGSTGAYRIGFANWRGGIPTGVNIDTAGTVPFRNDQSIFSIGTIGNIGIGTASPNASAALDLSAFTTSLLLPSGTTAQEPTSPVVGALRYNSAVPQVEAYYGGAWKSLGGTTYPSSGSIVLSNGTNSPAGLSESDGQCVVGTGGVWTTGSCAGTSSLNVGSSATAANPQRSGEAGTGFYTSASGHIDMSGLGAQIADFSASGLNLVAPALNFNGNNGVSSPASDTGGGSIAIGSGALAGQTAAAAYNNTAVGYKTLNGTMTTGATNNTAIGSNAGTAITSGSGNTAIGWNAGKGQTTQTLSTYIGAQAGQFTNGGSNVAIGNASLFGTGNTGSYATAIGTSAMANYACSFCNSFDVAIGYNAAGSLTTGLSNTILGSNVASTTLTTGSNNILIGTSAAVTTPAAATSNWLNIGNTITGSIAADTTTNLTACGTSPAILGSDIKGTITEGSAATGCTLTFATARANDPACMIASESGGALSYTHSTAGFIITNVGVLSGTKLDYICLGN